MIIIDWPLGLTSLFFLVISFAYGWGLLRWFAHCFRWSLASTVGIASVVSMCYVFVWQVRGIDVPLQAVWDLAIIFLAALPGMIMVDYQLKKTANQKMKTMTILRKTANDRADVMIYLIRKYQSFLNRRRRVNVTLEELAD